MGGKAYDEWVTLITDFQAQHTLPEGEIAWRVRDNRSSSTDPVAFDMDISHRNTRLENDLNDL